MLIRNKYFPYPVIAAGNDSYATATFTSDVDFEKNGYHIKLILKASTNNDGIKELIKAKRPPLFTTSSVYKPAIGTLLSRMMKKQLSRFIKAS